MSMSLGVLSTYPPTQCGLATFSRALVHFLKWSSTRRVGVVRVVDAVDGALLPAVNSQWVQGSRDGFVTAAVALNRYDVAIIQHEYGIYGGRDGEDVLQVLRRLQVPVITVLHTVLAAPTAHQREILEELAALSEVVVPMTQTGRQRLVDHYAVDPAKIRVIPHGAIDNRADGPVSDSDGTPQILTWGLLGEGKGIEWAIEAMALLRDLRPTPHYSVVGQTHPRVLETRGERYRDALVRRADRLGVSGAVTFDAHYLPGDELRRVVRKADIVLLPYDSAEQVTSGVLIEAIAAGKPVISTAFPHAQELLSTGAGLLVARRDPAAIAGALRRVLTEPGLAVAMAAEANRLAPALLWPAVAEQYRALAAEARATPSRRTGTTIVGTELASA
jgi:polysaccharide biosynthesis protein PslF